jgi:shikimate kinase
MSDAVVVLPGGRAQIHLAGFMGSGKSTVGRLLARHLMWNFLDLDGVIGRHEGRSVARIFAESGESAFRDSERHVLRQVVSKPSTVVALGGGTLIDADNQARSRRHAALVWLRCPLEVLEARCARYEDAAARRPLWGDPAALQQRYDERLPGYEAAEFVVDADDEAEAVVLAVLEVIGAAL